MQVILAAAMDLVNESNTRVLQTAGNPSVRYFIRLLSSEREAGMPVRNP